MYLLNAKSVVSATFWDIFYYCWEKYLLDVPLEKYIRAVFISHLWYHRKVFWCSFPLSMKNIAIERNRYYFHLNLHKHNLDKFSSWASIFDKRLFETINLCIVSLNMCKNMFYTIWIFCSRCITQLLVVSAAHIGSLWTTCYILEIKWGYLMIFWILFVQTWGCLMHLLFLWN